MNEPNISCILSSWRVISLHNREVIKTQWHPPWMNTPLGEDCMSKRWIGTWTNSPVAITFINPVESSTWRICWRETSSPTYSTCRGLPTRITRNCILNKWAIGTCTTCAWGVRPPRFWQVTKKPISRRRVVRQSLSSSVIIETSRARYRARIVHPLIKATSRGGNYIIIFLLCIVGCALPS